MSILHNAPSDGLEYAYEVGTAIRVWWRDYSRSELLTGCMALQDVRRIAARCPGEVHKAVDDLNRLARRQTSNWEQLRVFIG